MKMFSDPGIIDLKKMQYKYSKDDVSSMLVLLKEMMYGTLPLCDFNGQNIVYLDNVSRIKKASYKMLHSAVGTKGVYGVKAMSEEIHATLSIENINSSRDSINKIMSGFAPKDEEEKRIFGIKAGLDFISDALNKITEENIYRLYEKAIGDFLDENEKLKAGQFYRHDAVYVVSSEIKHQGLHHEKLPEYMRQLIAFINTDDEMDDLLKAVAIHFYIAYLHPYFDGNGRMARLIHLWYLVQRGYPAAMYTPFSRFINESRSKYYKAYTQIAENEKISGLVDVTPFLVYFIENVYSRVHEARPDPDTIESYKNALAEGKITEKEKSLFAFVLSAYGNNEFSTKKLEKDFGNAAYATIRNFVLKFEEMGILKQQKYGARVKYSVM